MNKDLNYFDFGDIALKDCDDANIPVCCFLCEPEEDEYWTWIASNFMPRKERITESSYKIKAKTKEDILKAVNKYVVPLYWIAVNNLINTGKLYYWHDEQSVETEV